MGDVAIYGAEILGREFAVKKSDGGEGDKGEKCIRHPL